MENIRIRIATRQDLPDILLLYQELAAPGEEELSLSDAGKLFDKINSYPCYKIYVACVEEKIVGTFALLIMDNLVHHGSPSGIVEDVAVAPHLRGKGIGKQMMHFAMQTCREHGGYKLVLSSNKKREDAHRFYKNLGFSQHGYSFHVPL